MSTNSDAPLLDPSDTGLQIQQKLTGDRNQIIGQAVSSTIVNVTGSGQVTIYQSQLERALQSESEPAPSAIGPNPYKGLLAFQETDGNRFFGREKQIEPLWQKFRVLHEEEASIRMLPIYGPSGSGKSSLARAGLIPELAQRPLPGHDRARVAILVPGTHPLETLATVLARVATDDPTPVAKTREFAEELVRANHAGDCDGLRRIADVLPDIARSPLIVLVDQFEEVYTLCGDTSERSSFISNLLCAAGDRSKRVSVIITLRSDFLGETQKHPLLNRLFSQQGFLVPAMDEEELRQAIRQPAALAGHPLDEATVSLLIEQTEGREGALPLLQFALTRIWEGMTEGVAPAVTLERIGGVGGALAGEAQRVYDSLMPEEQAIVRRVFLGLVQLGEGTRDTRRRVAINNLVSYKSDSSQVRRVLSRFTDPGVRLITRSASSEGTETAEVTHEALFDHWQLLNDWLDQSRDDLRFQRRLEDDAQHWEQNGRPDGNLWRPPDLDLLKQYHDRSGDDMTPLEVEFFKASNRAENNRKRLRLIGIGVLAGGFFLTTGLMIFAGYQLQRAERQQVEQLATTAEALLLTRPTNAEITALAAVGLSRKIWFQPLNGAVPASVFSSLLLSVQTNQERNVLVHEDWLTSVAFSPDGKTIASGSVDNTIYLWDISTGKLIGQLRGHGDQVNSVAFSPDGKMLVSAGSDKTIRLWDVSTSKLIWSPLRGHEDRVWSVAFSPDGKMLVSAGSDKTIRLWDVSERKAIGQPILGHGDTVNAVVFSPDGKTIASGSSDKTIRLWDSSTGKSIKEPLLGHEDMIWSVAFSPDGKTIASGSSDKTIRLWDSNTGEAIGPPLRGHEDAVSSVTFSSDGKMIASSGRNLNGEDKTVRLWDVSIDKPIGQPFQRYKSQTWSVAFSPDGKVIASGSRDTTVWLWDASTGELIRQLQGHEEEVWWVTFSPDGKTIASGSGDTTVRLWNASTGKLIFPPLRGHAATVNPVAFSPDGRMLASGSNDDTVRLWDVSTGKSVKEPLRGHGGAANAIAFSPDGRMLASGGDDNAIHLWDVGTGEAIGQLQGHEDRIWAVVFSPDGKTIASGSEDATVRLWDVSTGKAIKQPLLGHQDAVASVAFSPDGKMIVSGSADKTLRLWDVSTGQAIKQPLLGHQDAISSVVFSPDGKMIVSGSPDGTIRLWEIASVRLEALLQLACKQLRYHPSLTEPKTTISKEAKQTCQRYIWSNQ